MPLDREIAAQLAHDYTSAWNSKSPEAVASFYAEDGGIVINKGEPWRGLEAMITRMDPKTNAGDKLGEGIELEAGIKILTINGAIAMMHEDVAGSIEVGKHADMILLDRNLFEIPVIEISEVMVLRTIFVGEVVYRAD